MPTIAYLVNQYPKVSHSFIRREISALEEKDIQIKRFSLRSSPEALVDPDDQIESRKTFYILNTSLPAHARSILKLLLARPTRFLRALGQCLAMGYRSNRGLIRHCFYFVEACTLTEQLRKQGISHVHAHFGTNSTAVAALAHHLGGTTYSFTIHGPEEFDKPECLAIARKVRYAAFVVTVSSFGRSQVYRWIPCEAWPKVKVVHCGFEPAYRNGATPSQDARRLVCVGRLCEQKGQLLLVQAVAKLTEERMDFKLILAGDGPHRAEIEKLIDQHMLREYVEITGWISSRQVRDELLAARALVLPSFAEGLPVVIMEAMALRRPVLSTYVAGIPELVIPGENGWLIPAGSIDLLVEGMKEVLDAPADVLRELGEHAQQRVFARHDIHAEADKLKRHFLACAGTPRC